MKILIVGGSGFIGTRVIELLRERGDEIVLVGRNEARLRKKQRDGVTCFQWDPAGGPLPAAALTGVDGVINLAGDAVDKGRWSKAKKARIRDSRVVTTRNLVAGLAAADPKPAVLVQASAIGYYGDCGHNLLHEGSPCKQGDFLAEVCEAWEAEGAKARAAGIRTAIVRIGVVLGKGGGAYPQISMPFRLFAGGTIGLGKMWMSWIHLDDVAGILIACVDNEKAGEVYNATAPNPVSNMEFTKTLGKVLKRPTLLPVPPIALRVLKGEFAKIITGSTRVRPLRTISIGYEFQHPTLEEAITSLES